MTYALIQCKDCGREDKIWSDRVKKKKCLYCGSNMAKILNIYYPDGTDLKSRCEDNGTTLEVFLKYLKEHREEWIK